MISVHLLPLLLPILMSEFVNFRFCYRAIAPSAVRILLSTKFINASLDVSKFSCVASRRFGDLKLINFV